MQPIANKNIEIVEEYLFRHGKNGKRKLSNGYKRFMRSKKRGQKQKIVNELRED